MSDILFPCKECSGDGEVWSVDDYGIYTGKSESCDECKGNGKSERQLLLDIQATQAQILELLQRPAPSQVPGRRDVVYGPSPHDQVIGPGLRKKTVVEFPTLTEADKADLRARMDVARAERAKKGK